MTLDPEGKESLPSASEGDRVPAAAVRKVMRRTIPVRSDWLHSPDGDSMSPPGSWTEHPMLGDLRVLYQPVQAGTVQAVQVGDKTLHLDENLGLVRG
ncbi:hypothetical protein [Streptomyces sp. 11-1-2]|uniref:hypothetical protein n=1 Tax=Streptomyces sp. 11-1-2 TaxID=1851167 RepID=UPI001F08B32B|nr:hypothetical protein [Streptomyces sp. 11-1-2]